ncbi:MAG TPA: hypothetical protein VFT65_06675 [Candidatus Angelobacter sp.]|nr:hypothetical protein [Candidatus Angelobacter sp.]
MKPRLPILLILLLLIQANNPGSETAVTSVDLQVSADVKARDVQHIGVNLGGWSSWGAEQLGSNIIQNPGFEGVIDRALATVKSIQGARYVLGQDATWRPEGFWRNAELNFRTGQSAGKSVHIVGSERDNQTRQETVIAEFALPAAAGDVVSLTRTSDLDPPTQWWIGTENADCPPGPARPGSPGVRSFTLCPTTSTPAQLNSFLDTITARAGKLLPVDGAWQFSFWTMAVGAGPRLHVSFSRGSPFFSRWILPGGSWRRVTIRFNAVDTGPDGPLQLHFEATGPGLVRLDDLSLVRAEDRDFPFRNEVINTLALLQPGYLRDWQGQLGDTLANRMAPPFERRAVRYRSGNRDDAHYEYSIPEFLELCHRVHCNPWIVLPTTFSDTEARQLGEYLRAAQEHFQFHEILVEFGNENWNPLFATAGIQDPRLHGEAASRAFDFLRQGTGGSVPLRTVINAQFANPASFAEFARYASADMVAVAPYFAYDLPDAASSAQLDSLLFASANSALTQMSSVASIHRQELAVYEVNLHTVGGTAGTLERNRMVLSAAAASALAKRLIEAMLSGARRECVYSLSGYDSTLRDRKGLVQLWGVARDLASTPHLRASGLALEMLNESIQGEAHEIHAAGSAPSRNDLTGVAFRGTAGWSVALVSSRTRPVEVNLLFPATADTLPAELLTLSADKEIDGTGSSAGQAVSIHRTKVVANEHSIKVLVPPRTLVVLLPQSHLVAQGAKP